MTILFQTKSQIVFFFFENAVKYSPAICTETPPLPSPLQGEGSAWRRTGGIKRGV